MVSDYFARVRAETPTRLWVNNPTSQEVGLALALGAAGCTTNPTFTANLLRTDRERDVALSAIDDAIAETRSDDAAAAVVQRRLAARVASMFLPLYEQSGKREGFVSIQGSPLDDEEADAIISEGRAGRALGPNLVPKLPATKAGLTAMKALVAVGNPVIVTEVFSLSQVVSACEKWLAATAHIPNPPPFFMSPITGIFGDHLKKVATRGGIACDGGDLDLAGIALARACHRLVVERGYPVTLLFGGARTTLDFTGLVGGRTASTINYSTAAQIVDEGPEMRPTIDDELPAGVLDRLTASFADFRVALTLDGLTTDEFEGFGPVQHFRDVFIAGWRTLLEAVAERRSGNPIAESGSRVAG